MKPVPGQPIPYGCAVVTPQCTFGEHESDFRMSMARQVGHIVKVPEVKRWSPPRSNRKNRTVRGFWLPIVLEERGYYPHDAQFIYDQIKIEMGWTEDRVDKRTGLITKVPKPTANLSDDEYSVWMKNWRGYVEDQDSGLGILLPEPDPTMAKI